VCAKHFFGRRPKGPPSAAAQKIGCGTAFFRGLFVAPFVSANLPYNTDVQSRGTFFEVLQKQQNNQPDNSNQNRGHKLSTIGKFIVIVSRQSIQDC
jgi:hypothetical protein